MSFNTGENEEYFTVHESALRALTEGITSVISKNPDIVIEKDETAEPLLLKTPFTSEFIFDLYEGQLDQESTTNIAAIRNRSQLAQATEDFLSLQATGSMIAAMEDLEEYRKSHAENLFLRYKKAHQEIAFRKNLVLTASHLFELERYDSALRVDFTKPEGLVTKNLQLQLFSNKIETTVYSLAPTQDEQLLSWAHFLGEDLASIIGICSGVFENEEELDEKLSELYMRYQGTSKEEEISPILDQVRIRAMSVKESLALRLEFRGDLPSAEQLSEAIEEVKAL